MIKTVLLIAAGGALGSVARHGVNQMAARISGTDFPWGTLGVNVMGSLLIGVIAGLLAFMTEWSQDVRASVVVGILGGFTTFSAFSLDAVLLAQKGQYGLMAAYIGASVFVSILAAKAGLMIIRTLAP